MDKHFNILVEKLNRFRKKYYLFKLIKGFLSAFFILISLYIVVSVSEYYFYFVSNARLFIYFSLIILALFLLIYNVLIPLLHYLSLIPQINNKSVNRILSEKIPELKDTLLNVIELYELKNASFSDEILLASIHQKIESIRLFDFRKVVTYTQLLYVSSYVIFCAIVVILIGIFHRPILTESNFRIVNYNTEFIKPPPFDFELQNKNLNIKKGEGTVLSVKCIGNRIPDDLWINIGNNNFLMNKLSDNLYEYRIESVINDFSFYFTDNKFRSEAYSLKVLNKPLINRFIVTVSPPNYTALTEEKLENIGDLNIAAGSIVKWDIYCLDTDSVFLNLGEQIVKPDSEENNIFSFSEKITANTSYGFSLKNSNFYDENSVNYSINTVADLLPEIDIVQQKDSFNYSLFYFKGSINDDYGFSDLSFHYNIDNSDSTFTLPFIESLSPQEFYFSFDFKSLNFSSGIVTYYFSVTDNDGVSGYKTTTSNSFIFNFPDENIIKEFEKEQFKSVEDLLTESKKLSDEIKSSLDELKLKNLNSNLSDWEKSELVNNILEKKSELENIIQQANEINKDVNNYLNSFTEQNQDIMEKQALIEELLEDVFTDELKDLLEQFNELSEEFNSKKFNELSENLDMSFDDLSEQLDKNLEILRKMKVEQKMQQVIDNLFELAQTEEKLADQFINKKDYLNTLNQDTLNNKKLNTYEHDLKEILDLNNKLKKPLNLDGFEGEFNNIREKFSENKEHLTKKRRKKSEISIKNTSESINELAFNLYQLFQSNLDKQQKENINDLKQILSNLLVVSFGQEEINQGLVGINSKDPIISDLASQQKLLKDNSTIIKDSLYALALRVPQVSNTVNNELLSVEINLSSAVSMLEEGLIDQSRAKQQYVITGVNNLALLLNEILDQLEKMQANAQPGDQQCENPDGDGNSMDGLKQSAQDIKKQLEEMINEMKNGNGKKMSQMTGQSLIQHEMMQNMLRELMNSGVGSEAKKQLQQVDDLLEDVRKDLINKNITQNMLFRQNAILDKLLKAEKAEMERDFEDKRESETAEDEFYSNPLQFLEYNKQQKTTLELLQKENHQLNKFYDLKYKNFLDRVNEQPIINDK